MYELDRHAAKDGGSRKLTYDEAMKLAQSDAAQLTKRLRDEAARPRLEKQLPWREPGDRRYRWAVVDQRGTTYASGRSWTVRGGQRAADDALIAVRTEQLLSGNGSAGYAADPACQHGMPFTGPCDPCGRAEA